MSAIPPKQLKWKLKALIKTEIERFLYGKADARHTRLLTELINENDLAINTIYHLCFRYKSKVYDLVPGALRRVIPKLQPEFHERMDKLIADIDLIERSERPLAMGFVQKVLNTSDRPEDYLVLFPTSLHPAIATLLEQLPSAGSPLSMDQSAELAKANAKGLDMLKMRLVMNMLEEQ